MIHKRGKFIEGRANGEVIPSIHVVDVVPLNVLQNKKKLSCELSTILTVFEKFNLQMEFQIRNFCAKSL